MLSGEPMKPKKWNSEVILHKSYMNVIVDFTLNC